MADARQVTFGETGMHNGIRNRDFKEQLLLEMERTSGRNFKKSTEVEIAKRIVSCLRMVCGK
jgi:hypothetical protein